MITQSHKTNEREKNQSGDWNNNGEIVSQFPLDSHLKEETRNIGGLSVSRSHSHAKDTTSLKQHGGNREPLIGENPLSESSILKTVIQIKTLTQMQQAIASEKQAAIRVNVPLRANRHIASRRKGVLIEKSSLEEGLDPVFPKTSSVLSTEHAATISIQDGLSPGQGSGVKGKDESACQSGLLWETSRSIENIEHLLNLLRDHFHNANNLLQNIYQEIAKKVPLNAVSIKGIENYLKDEKNAESKKIVEKAQKDVGIIARIYNTQALAPIVATLQEPIEKLEVLRDKDLDPVSVLDYPSSQRFILNRKITETEALVNEIKSAQKFDRIFIGSNSKLTKVISFSTRDMAASEEQEKSVQNFNEAIPRIYEEILKITTQNFTQIDERKRINNYHRKEKIREIISKYNIPALNSHSREYLETVTRQGGETWLNREKTAHQWFSALRTELQKNPDQMSDIYTRVIEEIKARISEKVERANPLGTALKTDLLDLKCKLENVVNQDENTRISSLNRKITALEEKYREACISRIAKYDLSPQGMYNFADLAMQAMRELRPKGALSRALTKSDSRYEPEQINPESPDFDCGVAFTVMGMAVRGIESGTPKATGILQKHMISMLVRNAQANPEAEKDLYESYFAFAETIWRDEGFVEFWNANGKNAEEVIQAVKDQTDEDQTDEDQTDEEDTPYSISKIAKLCIQGNFRIISSNIIGSINEQQKEHFQSAFRLKVQENLDQADKGLFGGYKRLGDHLEYTNRPRYDKTTLARLDAEINTMLLNAEWRIQIPKDREYENSVLVNLEELLKHRNSVLNALGVSDENKPDFVCRAGHFLTCDLKGQSIKTKTIVIEGTPAIVFSSSKRKDFPSLRGIESPREEPELWVGSGLISLQWEPLLHIVQKWVSETTLGSYIVSAPKVNELVALRNQKPMKETEESSRDEIVANLTRHQGLIQSLQKVSGGQGEDSPNNARGGAPGKN